MTKTNMSYNEAVKFASYHEVHRRVAEGRGDQEAARAADQQLRGMAKLICTLYGTWDDDDYGKAYQDIVTAADEYMGR